MERMKFETPDMVAGNVEKIGAMFPNCVTEALDEEKSTPDKPVYKKAINFELLKQMLSGDVVEGDEAYEFTWVGKKAAIVEANKPIRATLRPCPEESVNWDTTENLYIEGDNLQVLKLLQESYLGKIKMIYIDPPYNTGNDFIYRDNYAATSEEYQEEQGLYDEDNNRLFHNTDSNGRFHSDWCSMIYPRLVLARNLLTMDGAIFISIDDHEAENLKKICDEVFGASNFIATIIWRKNYAPKSSAQFFSVDHDYILVYSKSASMWRPNLLPRTERQNSMYSNPDNDPRGPWMSDNLSARNPYSLGTYAITCPSGRIIPGPPTGRNWIISEEKFKEYDREGRIYWTNNGDGTPRLKRYLSEVKQGIVPQTYWAYEEVGHTQDAKKELLALVDFPSYDEVFDTPKPTKLIDRILQIATNPNTNDIVLDFFSGSATTGHSVMKVNATDGGNRRYIMVQLADRMQSLKFETLADIGKERLISAGKKIQEELPLTTQDLDIGFRVLKLDSTNMKDVYYSPAEVTQAGLFDMVSNIKEDRTDLDLLFGCLIDWGLPLSLPYTSEQIDGCTVHTYNDGDLIACFDKDIPDSVIREIARRKPLRAVFRDSSFADSPAKINVFEIFKLLAPDASVRVI